MNATTTFWLISQPKTDNVIPQHHPLPPWRWRISQYQYCCTVTSATTVWQSETFHSLYRQIRLELAAHTLITKNLDSTILHNPTDPPRFAQTIHLTNIPSLISLQSSCLCPTYADSANARLRPPTPVKTDFDVIAMHKAFRPYASHIWNARDHPKVRMKDQGKTLSVYILILATSSFSLYLPQTRTVRPIDLDL
jgi:hypothetical protein